MNTVILSGTIASEIAFKEFDNAAPRASFRMLTRRRHRKKDASGKEIARVIKLDSHLVQAWGPVARSIEERLEKGDPIMVRGWIESAKYEKNGETKWVTFIVVNEWETPPTPNLGTMKEREGYAPGA